MDASEMLKVLDEIEDGLKEIESLKNSAYEERDRLVCALSKLFPSHLCLDTSGEDDWRNIVCIHLPTGQCTWHIHADELKWFGHLKMGENHWDGHTTEEKYIRVNCLRKE